MKINKINMAGISNIYKNGQWEAQKITSSKSLGKDDIILSESGRIFNVALKAVKDEPEIRMDKVKEMSAQLKSGNYEINKDGVAEAIFKNAFVIK